MRDLFMKGKGAGWRGRDRFTERDNWRERARKREQRRREEKRRRGEGDGRQRRGDDVVFGK